MRYPTSALSVLQEGSSDASVYTRESVCREAASFKRACGKFEDGLEGNDTSVRGERHCVSAVAFMVAGGGFEPPTFGLCDLTHLSMRVGLYLHPHGMLAIQSLRLPPPFRGLVRYCPIARAT